ncbi:MAG TPA: VIT1/CCC1 transporter family protein [bacterium]
MRNGTSGNQLKIWHEHWQDEGDAAFLYREIVSRETDDRRRRVFTGLATVEDQHLARWADVLRSAGVQLPPHRPSLRARIMALMGRMFGWRLLASLLLSEEGRETKGYLRGAGAYQKSEASQAAAELAKESAEHAEQLGELLGVSGEPWHRTASGGFLRNAVYGFNDGLTANFGLVMGVLGASVPHHIIVVSGVAGLIADALSMGSSGFLAAKSEREVYAHEIAVEREELRLMPDLEQAELALLYETRGLDPVEAKRAAAQVMEDPERALREKTHMELGIAEATMSPLREGWITGVATAVGAFIPVFPFLIMQGRPAILTAFTISMLSHFGVGAARSVFTGRGAFRSGADMFIVGLGIAGIGYLVGEWISRTL